MPTLGDYTFTLSAGSGSTAKSITDTVTAVNPLTLTAVNGTFGSGCEYRLRLRRRWRRAHIRWQDQRHERGCDRHLPLPKGWHHDLDHGDNYGCRPVGWDEALQKGRAAPERQRSRYLRNADRREA